MNISSGVSHIKINEGRSSKDLYIWPSYNPGKIDPVERVKRDNGGDFVFKSSPEEEKKVLLKLKDNDFFNYNSQGGISHQNSTRKERGLLFSAFA